MKTNQSAPLEAVIERDEHGMCEPRPSRRAWLAGGALAGFWATERSVAQDTTRDARPAPPEPGGRPVPPSVGQPSDALVRLVNRLTFGVTREEILLAQALGVEGYVKHHLNFEAIDDGVLDDRIAQNYPTLVMEPFELYPLQPQTVINQLIEATILRSVFSRRQLFERMVEFWTDHFNIDITKNLDRFLKTVDDREVVRAHALGTFPELLTASAHSPAMLYYLDNNVSFVGNPNENYARELLELHTMGADGGYVQKDVEDVARCFTGWTLYPTNAGVNSGKFRFVAGQHDNGPKLVLGHAIPAGGGYNDGLMVLDILANHPVTARFIARKLCKRFYAYEPSESMVSSVAATYLSTGGDIRKMLQTILLGHDITAAEWKYKRPYHLYMSALRAGGAVITNSNGIRSNLTAAGHLPFYWSPPDGYPDDIDFWVGLILPRWNFGASLANNQVSGSSIDINVFFNGVPNSADALVGQIDDMLFGGMMDPSEKLRIRDYLLPNPPTTQRRRDALGLAFSSPGFQWY